MTPISHPKPPLSSMALILCHSTTHQGPNYTKFQSNYNCLGNRFVHDSTLNKNTYYRTRTNRCAKKLSVKALFDDGGDDFRNLKRIIKLSSAIQNRSIKELFGLIGDECVYLFSSFPPIDVLQLSKNMFLLLHAMMLQHNVSFAIRPTADEGYDLSIKWSLGWKGRELPFGLNCSFSTTHVYKGMLLISQVNKALVPFLQSLPQLIQQKLDAIIVALMDKVAAEGTLEERKRSTAIVCAIISLVVMVLFYALFKHMQV